jgi:hypothetical protein
MKRQSNENTISEVLKMFVEKNKLQTGMDKIVAEQTWKEVMGPGVMSYTQKVELHGKTLHVFLASSVLREELSYGKQKIIKMINEAVNRELIKDLNLR